jgi:hypothetical protein
MTHNTIDHHEHGRHGYLSADAIAAVLGTSRWALSAWLQFGRDLGIRFELLPLLPVAYAELSGSEAMPAGGPHTPMCRERLVVTEDGAVPVEIGDPDEHARVDRYWEAVALAALTGDDRALRRFAGLSVHGIEFVTDYARLVSWAEAAARREVS